MTKEELEKGNKIQKEIDRLEHHYSYIKNNEDNKKNSDIMLKYESYESNYLMLEDNLIPKNFIQTYMERVQLEITLLKLQLDTL